MCPLVGIQLITECTPKANGGLIMYKKTTQYYVVCNTMVIWVTELSSGRYKIRYKDFCLKNQNTQRKFVNFENWCNGELSKIGHNFGNNVILKMRLSKMSMTKKWLKWYSSMKKIKILMIFDIEN